MAIRLVVTRGFGNGSFSGSIADIVRHGYTAGALPAPVFSGTIPNISLDEGGRATEYDLGAYFTGATSYSISPAIEPGWVFNTSTGILTVNPKTPGTYGDYVVTGTNASGSDASNSFGITVTATSASGGWWFAYEREMLLREERERKKLEAKAALIQQDIQDEIDLELIAELRRAEDERERLEELNRLKELAARHKKAIEEMGGKVMIAAERAIMKGTFSAMEQLEREIKRAREEELFLIQALAMILNE